MKWKVIKKQILLIGSLLVCHFTYAVTQTNTLNVNLTQPASVQLALFSGSSGGDPGNGITNLSLSNITLTSGQAASATVYLCVSSTVENPPRLTATSTSAGTAAFYYLKSATNTLIPYTLQYIAPGAMAGVNIPAKTPISIVASTNAIFRSGVNAATVCNASSMSSLLITVGAVGSTYIPNTYSDSISLMIEAQ